MSEVRAIIMIGALAGLTFHQDGLCGRLDGRLARAALMAACTSRAAPLMSRPNSNCRTMLVYPRSLEEVIWVRPAIWPNWRSSGAATEEATMAGLAPGNWASTTTVGKSTWGSGATGSCK